MVFSQVMAQMFTAEGETKIATVQCHFSIFWCVENSDCRCFRGQDFHYNACFAYSRVSNLNLLKAKSKVHCDEYEMLLCAYKKIGKMY